MNNKAYVFVPLILVLIFMISLIVVLVSNGFFSSVNQGVLVQGVIDSFMFERSKQIVSLINDFKLSAYANISSSFTVNKSLTNNPSFNVLIPSFEGFSKLVNVSSDSYFEVVTLNYPVNDLVSVVFDEGLFQECLNLSGCSIDYCAGLVDFGYFNYSFNDQRVGEYVNVSFELFSSGMTLVYPYYLGSFVFVCQ